MFFEPNDDDIDSNDRGCSYLESNEFNNLNLSNSSVHFSMFYLNARSLCKHFHNIQDYLCLLNHTFSIYAYSETWFKDTPPPYIHMENYNLIHS